MSEITEHFKNCILYNLGSWESVQAENTRRIFFLSKLDYECKIYGTRKTILKFRHHSSHCSSTLFGSF